MLGVVKISMSSTIEEVTNTSLIYRLKIDELELENYSATTPETRLLQDSEIVQPPEDSGLELVKMQVMESVMKVHNLITIELVPAQEYEAEQKTFEWSLLKFDQ